MSTKATVTVEGRLQGSFCSKTVFDISQKVVSEIEIEVLGKRLDFAPIQQPINEPELRKDFEDSLGEGVLDGISGTNLLNILQINQRFTSNPTGRFFFPRSLFGVGMAVSKKRIINWKTKLYIKISTLK